MHYAYRCWRRQWGTPNARECGGALVWQLNDCWPVVSWALVDYFLVKKPAFYAVKRDLSPLTISVIRTHDNWINAHDPMSTCCDYDMWIASDGGLMATSVVDDQQTRVEVELRFVSIRTGKDVFAAQRHQCDTLTLNGTTTVCKGVRLANLRGPDAFIIAAKLIVGGSIVSRDVDWPQPYKYISFADNRALKVQLTPSRTSIEVTALRPTKGLTFAERPGLRFGDNGFDVVPGERYVLDVQGLGEDERLEWVYLGMDEEDKAPRADLTRAHL